MSFPIISLSSLLTVLFPFLLSSLCALAISKLGRRISLIDNPNERSSHLQPTPRGGGIGIWLSFIILPFLFPLSPSHFKQITIVAGFVGLLGFLEDRFSLPSKVRLLLQLMLSAIATILLSNILFHPYFISLFLFIFWIIFITGTANFYNFMDGINGIAGLTGIVGFSLMAYFSYFILEDYNLFLMSMVLVSGCLGFLPFNFPKAKVFMGDVGSVFLGFIFASFVLKLSTNINIFLCLIMFLCTFYADSIVTIFYRWRRGENLMQAHKSHLYQYMSNELKIPHWKVSVLYTIVQIIIGLLAIWAYKAGILWQIVVVAVYSVLFIVVYKWIKSLKPLKNKIGTI